MIFRLQHLNAGKRIVNSYKLGSKKTRHYNIIQGLVLNDVSRF